jgi:hypothetical protein
METETTCERFKNWVKRHKKAIIVTSIGVVSGTVGIILIGKKTEVVLDEIKEIDDAFKEAQEWDGEGDRYVIDKETMEKLPAGTYDVFDMYENERIDFVVEKSTNEEEAS